MRMITPETNYCGNGLTAHCVPNLLEPVGGRVPLPKLHTRGAAWLNSESSWGQGPLTEANVRESDRT
jgi:hypothetical protein